MSVTTVSSNFPVIDVTHKPKRTQRDNLRRAEELRGVDISESSLGDNIVEKPPTYVTIESAIRYYENNAVGEDELLFKRTAEWLRQLMQNKVEVKE